MLKKTFISSILFTFISITTCSAQQIFLNSLYTVNRYQINSAYAGFNSNMEAYLSHREQWVGMKSAPSTSFFSLQSVVGENIGLGGTIAYDQTNLINTFSGAASFGYRIKLGKAHNIRLGVSAGIYQLSINMRKAIVDDPFDNIILDGNRSQISFKNEVSLYYNYKKLEFGLSIPQMFETAKTKNLSAKLANVQLKRHIVAFLGYDIQLNNKWSIQPSLLYKSFNLKNNQLDINAQVTYNNFISLGTGYRTNNGFKAQFGVLIKDIFQLAYAYEFSNTHLRKFNSGTHEIMLGIKFRKKEKDVVPELVVENKPEPIFESTEVEKIIEEKVSSAPIIEPSETEKIDSTISDIKIQFPLNNTSLDKAFTSELDKLAEMMKEHPQLKIEIIGHSCDLGTDPIKNKIAQQRADVVKNYLISKGINSSRLSSISKGDREPLVPNISEENRQKNRRIEFRVIQ